METKRKTSVGLNVCIRGDGLLCTVTCRWNIHTEQQDFRSSLTQLQVLRCGRKDNKINILGAASDAFFEQWEIKLCCRLFNRLWGLSVTAGSLVVTYRGRKKTENCREVRSVKTRRKLEACWNWCVSQKKWLCTVCRSHTHMQVSLSEFICVPILYFAPPLGIVTHTVCLYLYHVIRGRVAMWY